MHIHYVGNLLISIFVNAIYFFLGLYISHLEPSCNASGSRRQATLSSLVLHTPRLGKVSQSRFCDGTTFSSSSPKTRCVMTLVCPWEQNM
jgi:hypothetical protein